MSSWKATLGTRQGSVVGQLTSSSSVDVAADDVDSGMQSDLDLSSSASSSLATGAKSVTLQFQRSHHRSSIEADYLDEIDTDNDEIVTSARTGKGRARAAGKSKAPTSSHTAASLKSQGQGLLTAVRRWMRRKKRGGGGAGLDDEDADTVALFDATQDLEYSDFSEPPVAGAAAVGQTSFSASSPASAAASQNGDPHQWRLVKPRTSGRRLADNDNRIFLRTERDLGLVLMPPKRPSWCQTHCACRCTRWGIWRKRPCIVLLIVLIGAVYLAFILTIVRIVWD